MRPKIHPTILSLLLVLASTVHAVPHPARRSSTSSSLGSAASIDVKSSSLPPSVSHASALDTPRFLADNHQIQSQIAGLKKHIYPVPGTNIVLTLSLRERLDGVSLASFLAVTKDHVESLIARYGPDAGLPSGLFDWDMGEELEISVDSPPELDRPMTWALLKDTITGLQDFLIGSNNYRAASCRINFAGPRGAFLGYLNVGRRLKAAHKNAIRDLVLPSLNATNTLDSDVGVDANVHVDIRPQRQRLDLHAVWEVIVVSQGWAQEQMERTNPNHYIENDYFDRTLGGGVLLSMVAAPGKHLTYGLVLEALGRLKTWEVDERNARAVEFGIVSSGILKGAGSIKKDNGKRLSSER
ncbi:MAG: hypothetical protein Q9220_000009 [cf. Caloplaca sp. 1 TL-2023]